MLIIGQLFCLFSFRLVPLPLSLRVKGWFPRVSKGLCWPFLDSAGFSSRQHFCCHGTGSQGPSSSQKAWRISSEASLPQVIEQLGEDIQMLPRLSDTHILLWIRSYGIYGANYFFVNFVMQKFPLGTSPTLNFTEAWEHVLQNSEWWCTLWGELEQLQLFQEKPSANRLSPHKLYFIKN